MGKSTIYIGYGQVKEVFFQGSTTVIVVFTITGKEIGRKIEWQDYLQES